MAYFHTRLHGNGLLHSKVKERSIQSCPQRNTTQRRDLVSLLFSIVSRQEILAQSVRYAEYLRMYVPITISKVNCFCRALNTSCAPWNQLPSYSRRVSFHKEIQP
jgi:hypothetical protein